jgi:DNA-3-methyladenine glycosylase I
MPRCDWCKGDPLYVRYHDEEWGVPLREETRMFEFLLLEGAQAGLSWLTILKKREGYRRAFDDFSVEKVAAYSDRQLDALLGDSGIIRNRRKVYAARQNARAALELYEQGRSLVDLFWGYLDGVPIQNAWEHIDEVPAHTPLA